MEHENGWENLNKNLLAPLAKVRWTEMNRLQVRDACERAFYGGHRIVLWSVLMSVTSTCVWEERENGKQTWMSI
jgi:hypothetical protein